MTLDGVRSDQSPPKQRPRLDQEMGTEASDPIADAARQLQFNQDKALIQQAVEASTMVTPAGNAGTVTRTRELLPMGGGYGFPPPPH